MTFVHVSFHTLGKSAQGQLEKGRDIPPLDTHAQGEKSRQTGYWMASRRERGQKREREEEREEETATEQESETDGERTAQIDADSKTDRHR